LRVMTTKPPTTRCLLAATSPRGESTSVPGFFPARAERRLASKLEPFVLLLPRPRNTGQRCSRCAGDLAKVVFPMMLLKIVTFVSSDNAENWLRCLPC
jgi:hypothetical protein